MTDAVGLWLLILIYVVAAVLISQAVAPQNESEIRSEAERLMALSIDAKKRGDYAKADEFYAESKFFLRLLKDAGEDVEVVR